MAFDPSVSFTSAAELIQKGLDIIHSSQLAPALRYPPGHYYSPLTDVDEVSARIERSASFNELLADLIDFRDEHQKLVLKQYAAYYLDCPFEDTQTKGLRYYYQNNYFGYSDAIFLYCFLRHNQPSSVVEVGSGFSSALMLDTAEEMLRRSAINLRLTFIEPYPDRLITLLRDNDDLGHSVIQSKVQNIDPVDISSRLNSGDLLFIDSSHVVKCGSDLQFILFRILPALKTGVFIHFHDIFADFEYPMAWLESGVSWNECYILQAFLAHNNQYKIHFFTDYSNRKFPEWISENMPKCRKNFGGGLYIEKC